MKGAFRAAWMMLTRPALALPALTAIVCRRVRARQRGLLCGIHHRGRRTRDIRAPCHGVDRGVRRLRPLPLPEQVHHPRRVRCSVQTAGWVVQWSERRWTGAMTSPQSRVGPSVWNLAPGCGSNSWESPTAVARAAENVVAAMKLEGVRRLVIPLAWGSGSSREHAAAYVKLIAKTVIRRDYADFDAAEDVIAASGLDFSIAYFGALSDRPWTGRWHADPAIGTPAPMQIGRADLADYLLTAALTASTAGERVSLSSAPKNR